RQNDPIFLHRRNSSKHCGLFGEVCYRRIVHTIDLFAQNNTAWPQTDALANVICDKRIVSGKDLDAYSIATKRSNGGGRLLQGRIKERHESEKSEVAFIRDSVRFLHWKLTVCNPNDSKACVAEIPVRRLAADTSTFVHVLPAAVQFKGNTARKHALGS